MSDVPAVMAVVAADMLRRASSRLRRAERQPVARRLRPAVVAEIRAAADSDSPTLVVVAVAVVAVAAQ